MMLQARIFAAALALAALGSSAEAGAATRHRSHSHHAGPSYPMKADEFRLLMEKRIDGVRAIIDRKLDKRGVSAERKKAIHKIFDESSRELRAEIDHAAADGTVTQGEADKVKVLATGLRARVRERLRAEKDPVAREKLAHEDAAKKEKATREAAAARKAAREKDKGGDAEGAARPARESGHEGAARPAEHEGAAKEAGHEGAGVEPAVHVASPEGKKKEASGADGKKAGGAKGKTAKGKAAKKAEHRAGPTKQAKASPGKKHQAAQADPGSNL